MSIGDINSEENLDLVAFTGYAQVGKDEATKILQEQGYTRISFADPIRKAIYTLNPWVKTDDGFAKVRNIVDEKGWDIVKQNVEIRELLQVFGTEVGRELLGKDVWIKVAENQINNKNLNKVAVSDLRFENELEWVRFKKGKVIKIIREGVGPVNNHSSDNGIPDKQCDDIISNNNSLKELREKILSMVNNNE